METCNGNPPRAQSNLEASLLLRPDRRTSVRHDPFNSFMCGTTPLHVWRDPLPYSCIRVAEHLCAITQFIHVWHGPLICDMNPLYAWHDSEPYFRIRVAKKSVRLDPWNLSMCCTTHSCVCDMMHSNVCGKSLCATLASESQNICAPMTHSSHWCEHD